MLPLVAWLSAPAWLEAPQARHPAESAGDAAVTGEPARPEHDVRRAEPDGVFGFWLQRTLRSMLAGVAEEPIPAKLQRILEAAPVAEEGGTTKQP